MNKLISCLIFVLILTCNNVVNAVTFTNGHWSTSFNCNSIETCFDAQNSGSSATINGQGTEFLPIHNNPLGTHNGMRIIVGNGQNLSTRSGVFIWNTPASDIWIRFYIKYEQGFTWNPLNYDKLLYIGLGTFANDMTPVFAWQSSQILFDTRYANQLSGYTYQPFSGGWNTIMGGATGDGQWHCLEFRAKANSGGNNTGIYQLWVDGVNKVDISNANFPWTGIYWFIMYSNQCCPDNSSGIGQVWIDDVAISVSTPPGRDAQNRPFIGTLGTQPPPPVDTTPPVRSNGSPSGALPAGTTQTIMSLATNETATCRYSLNADTFYNSMTPLTTTGGTSHSMTISGLENGIAYNRYIRCIDVAGNTNIDDYLISFSVAEPSGDPGIEPGLLLFEEPFENNNWASRSWYDGTNSTGVAAGGYVGNALKFTWTSGQTRPAGFSVIRNTFNPTDELLVDYWVKYDTGWRGSGVNYHAHVIHLLSSDDDVWQSLGYTNSSLYFEHISDITSPYAIRPTLSHQDGMRVNTISTLPSDLRLTTEDRSANHCNTPSSVMGADSACYTLGTNLWYSANIWKAPVVSIPSGQWVHIQYHIKKNTFSNDVGNYDGIAKIWIDGVVALDRTDILFAANTYFDTVWNKIAIAPYIGVGSPINQSMWIDELKIYDGLIDDPSDPITINKIHKHGIKSNFTPIPINN